MLLQRAGRAQFRLLVRGFCHQSSRERALDVGEGCLLNRTSGKLFKTGHSHTRTFSHKSEDRNYTQGQEPSPGVREYFFYVDHHGRLFQDDSRMFHWTAALKEEKLLFNFFKRLRFNTTDRYPEFRFLSLCGKERNFIRCEDRPIVFHNSKILPTPSGESWHLLHNHAGDKLAALFQPRLVTMVPSTGRVYHPGPKGSGGVGLVADRLSILWTEEQRFIFGNGEEQPPTAFIWEEEEIPLTNSLLELMTTEEREE